MQRDDKSKKTGQTLRYAVLAGLAGGFVEILWIALYTSLTSGSGVEVARWVTATAYPSVAGLPAAPAIGIAIHLALSVALAVVFVRLHLDSIRKAHGGRRGPIHHGGGADGCLGGKLLGRPPGC